MNREAYTVLANLSAGYSILKGRLPMYSSPVRHFTTRLPRILVRLACVRRAASVRSEPGSNSQKIFPSHKGRHFNTLTCCFFQLFFCQRARLYSLRRTLNVSQYFLDVNRNNYNSKKYFLDVVSPMSFDSDEED